MFFLPQKLRDKLKEPIGTLVDEPGLIKLLKNKKYIVSIGDRVTFTLLNHGIQPSIAIVDFILERKTYPPEMKQKIQGFGKKHIKIVNPPGFITEQLWKTIQSSYENLHKNESVLIEIEGEEDLTSLPAIFLAPRDVTIIYGLPNKGVLVVQPTSAYKKKVEEVLDIMRDAYGNRDPIKKC
jgi:GTP-dependent dephospho-CoA kinase